MAIKYTGPVPPIKQKNSELAQISLKAVQASTNPDQQLLSALWSSPTEKYQIGALDRKTKKFRNIPVNSIDEACQLAKELSEAGSDAYFAMAGFKTSANRQAANVSGASCLWVDLDCGEDKAKSGKGYLTIEDADKALKQFCTATGISLPTQIVDSGGGLHVYWELDTFVGREAWLDTAKKLKELAHKHSFLADPTRTADAASVLRLPGTLNYKYDPPRTVTLIHSSPEPINAKTMLDAIEKAYNLLIKQPAIQQKPVAVLIAKTGGENAGETAAFQKQACVLIEGNWTIGRLAALLEHIDPEEGGRPAWIAIGMALHNVTTGSDEGLDLFDQWSKRGATYPGKRGIEVQWRSFNSSSENRHNIGTIINRVKAAGHDWMDITPPDEQFQPCEFEVITDSDDNRTTQIVPVAQPTLTNPLDQYSLRGKAEEIAKEALDQVPILDGLANTGQASVYFAPPNSGKTLLVFNGLCEDVKHGRLSASALYYVNVDDSAKGIADKLAIADEYGFHMLSEGYNCFKAADLLGIISGMAKNDQARGIVIALDTLKKFTNVMDKTTASQFTKVIRRFVLKGGTIIALAHTNKKAGSDGKPIYGGTSDIVDDFDCAYTIAAGLSQNSDEKVVVFDNIKRRGNNPNRVAYRYSIESNLSYAELLSSVVKLEDCQIAEAAKKPKEDDKAIVAAIKECITKGINTKMSLADAAAKIAGASKRLALAAIERYTGEDPAVHKWTFTVGERGAKVFTLLDNTTPPASTET